MFSRGKFPFSSLIEPVDGNGEVSSPFRCYPIMFQENGNNLLLYPSLQLLLFFQKKVEKFYPIETKIEEKFSSKHFTLYAKISSRQRIMLVLIFCNECFTSGLAMRLQSIYLRKALKKFSSRKIMFAAENCWNWSGKSWKLDMSLQDDW